MDIYGNKLVNTIATKPLCASWDAIHSFVLNPRGIFPN